MTATSKDNPKTPISQNIAALATEVERDPTDLVAKISLANALEQAGEVSRAVALYQEVIALDKEGIYGLVSQKALEALETSGYTSQLPLLQHEETQSSFPLQRRHKALPLLQWLQQGWENLNLRTKLTILLVGSAAIPVILVTQGIENVATARLLNTYESKIKQDLSILNQEIEKLQEIEQVVAASIAKSVENVGINLSNPIEISAHRQLLFKFIADSNNDRFKQSFHIITDSQGRTVAQNIAILDEDFSSYPALSPRNKLLTLKYRQLSLPLGIALGDIPIVKNALITRRPLAGIELLNAKSLQRLGLDKQANIGIRKQKIEGLPVPKQPSPERTYDIDQGKVGLVVMAVQPIQVNGRQVGTAIVGTLLNRNYAIVDQVREERGIATATLFAKDWRVSTNVPYTDGKTRAIGTRVSREVAQTVLDRGETFLDEADILGTEYLTSYSPLYDHQKQLNPQAKAIGIAYVGEPKTQVEHILSNLRLTGYGIGGGMLLLAGLSAIPIASSLSRPLRRLSNFAQQVEAGEQGVRLEPSSRGDEIGVLSRQLNAMTASIEANLETVRHQEALRYQEAERQRLEKERLQQGAIELLLDIEAAQKGDLTVRAKVKEQEMGSIADAFNTVIESLRQIVIQVQSAANLVHESAFDTEASMQKLTGVAKTQAKVVARALNSVEEIDQSIQSVDSSAQKAAAIARQALVAAQDGDKTMDRTVVSIETIHKSVAETTKKAKRLAESSQEISKIVSIISGISEKTNLLAFNASIEATRAGENGKGFRIVADEVRRLAERVTDSTKEIEQLVSTIQQETSDVLQTMEGSTMQVVTGTQLVAKTKQTLQGLAQISQEIDQLLQSISGSTVFQTRTSTKVNKTMHAIAATQQTTASESVAVLSSMQELVKIAEELQNSVSRFRVEK